MKEKFNIMYEDEKKEGYEVNSISKKILNLALVPLLNSIPRSFQKHIQKTHKSADDIIKHATTHKAIEVLYKKGDTSHSKSKVQKFFHSVWFNTSNSKAVRNRLLLVKREIKSNVSRVLKEKSTVKILSIASGSARGIIEVVSSFSKEEQRRISIMFLDKNPHALLYSKKLMAENNVISKAEFVGKTVGSFFREIGGEQFDLIEIVGLLDYFDDEKLSKTLDSICKHLYDGGVVLASNISPNSEQPFVTKAVGWVMIYRSAENFGSFFVRAGMSTENITIYYEPLRIHVLVSATK